MSQDQQHFALVPSGSQPLVLPGGGGNASKQKKDNIRLELTDLYQSYANLYPNPKLGEEARQRDTLLQAASAATNFSNSQSKQQQQTKRRGFFSRLFGGGAEDDEEATTTTSNEDGPSASASPVPPLDPLVYTDLPNEHDDGSLCGTLQSIDLSCIPAEAYQVARFHLASTHQRRHHPNTIRWGPHTPEKTLVIVGLGVIAEFTPNQPTGVAMTSDREGLQEYAAHREPFCLYNARAAAISENCIAVSWGFIDGIVVIYRRMTFPDAPTVGWEAVFSLGPTPPVLENMIGEGGDFFHDDAEHPGSPLLRVSETLPLRVETGDERQPLVATLVLSRLGGYLELVPLPAPLWNGPILTPDNHRRQKPPKRRRAGQHYARQQVDCLPQTLALTTVEYHIDILTLEAFRTSVTADTGWDRQAFPNGPPSEFVVAASGMSPKGFEMATFWSLSTLFSENFEEGGGGIQFQLHASLLEVVSVETGADVSVFASDGIMKRWRTPRQVALRSDGNIGSSSDSREDAPAQDAARITTISTTAPIVTMKFCKGNGVTGPYLAVLDWNGAVTLFDCAVMQRIASQSLQPHEYELLNNANEGGPPFPFLSLAVSRAHFHQALRTKLPKADVVSNLQWLNNNSQTYIMDGVLPPLVVLSGSPMKVSLATFSLDTTDDPSTDVQPPRASIVSHSFPGDGASIEILEDGNLSLVLGLSNAKRSVLNHIQMRQLDPVAIVQSLARESKFEEAIQATKRLSVYDQEVLADVVVDCHRHLWESKRDIDSLAETLDVTYIVDQAISTCEATSESFDGLSVENLRLICNLAITMGRNYQPTKNKIDELRSFLVKLGTFELLCGLLSTETSFERFCTEFRSLSVVDLSVGLARRGEIRALSIVLFRHRLDAFSGILHILDTIPLSIHPNAYGHLLPLVSKDGLLTDSFLKTAEGDDSRTHLSQMPQYTSEKYGVHVVMDQGDEKLVLDSMQSARSDNALLSSISNWFVDRATKMQHFVGNVETVVRFCELGLKCTDTSPTQDAASIQQSPLAIQRLYANWRSSISLRRMVVDDIVSIEASSKETCFSGIGTDELLSMDWVDLVDMVLGGEDDVEKLTSRCNDYLQPLAQDTALLKREEDGTGKLDDAVALYCTRKVNDCSEKTREGGAEGLENLKSALSCCSAVATTSRTSIAKEQRVIKNKSTLIDMVMTVAYDVFNALESSDIPNRDSQAVIESLWTMYEALPAHIPSRVQGSDSWLPKMEKIQRLRRDLVCADVLSRWPESRPFEVLMSRQRERMSSHDSKESEVGDDTISRLCRSFCTEARHLDAEDQASSLLDLLSDVESLNETCFDGSCDIPWLLSLHLVHPLLHMSQFHLITGYLNSKPSIVDREKIKQAVLDYVDNAVFSEDGDSSTIVAAMKCQDVIGPVFPDIQRGFAEIRRYLDAAHFAETVIYEGSCPKAIRPRELRGALPLDVIESLLENVPDSIACGHPQWADRVFARDSNKVLRAALDRTDQHGGGLPTQPALPVLPGGAIFHLATILGLDNEASALVVKCRVVHHGVKNGLHGAAAAICRGLLNDGSPDSLGVDAVALAKLGAVATIVCDDSYGDLATRRELCSTALAKCRNNVNVYDSAAFNAITQTSAVLDHRSSRFSREQQDLPADRHQALLQRPIARLYRHILSDYNADVHALFSDLLGQTAKASVHDTLMNALGRFTVYWCISYSKTLKLSRHPIDAADFLEYLALGCSLILHIPSKETASSCVLELQTIAADQAASVSMEERFGGEDEIVDPDPEVVRQLIGRGYCENAANRAVIMSGNRGYNEALGWAVVHTMDEDFNDPVMILKMPDRKFIDENLIQALHKCLFATARFIQDREDFASFLNEISTTAEIINTAGGTPLTGKTVPPEIRQSHAHKPRQQETIQGAGDIPAAGNIAPSEVKPSTAQKTTPREMIPMANETPIPGKPTPPEIKPHFAQKPRPQEIAPTAREVPDPGSMAPYERKLHPAQNSIPREMAPMTSETPTPGNTAPAEITSRLPKKLMQVVPEAKPGPPTKTSGIKSRSLAGPPVPSGSPTQGESTLRTIPPTPPGFQSKRTVEISSTNGGLQLPNDTVSPNRHNHTPQKTHLANEQTNGGPGKLVLPSALPRGLPTSGDTGIIKSEPTPSANTKLPVLKATQESRGSRQPPPPPRPHVTGTASVPHSASRPTTRLQSIGLTLSKLDTSQSTTPSGGAKQPSPSGLSPFNAEDREELRKRGKQALTKLRSIGSPADDRRRLIEEGRQLLRLARQNGTPTTPTRYTPRARVPPPPPRVQATNGVSKTKPPPPPPPPPPPKEVATEGDDDSGWDFDNFDDF